MAFVFRLLSGGHRESSIVDGKRVKQDYVRGDVFESNDALHKKFGTIKFELIEKNDKVVDVSATPSKPVADKTSANPSATKDDGDDLGNLVTADFDDAEDLGVEVYEKSGWYTIYRDDKRINEKALRKSEVAVALDNLTEDE